MLRVGLPVGFFFQPFLSVSELGALWYLTKGLRATGLGVRRFARSGFIGYRKICGLGFWG